MKANEWMALVEGHAALWGEPLHPGPPRHAPRRVTLGQVTQPVSGPSERAEKETSWGRRVG